MPASTERNPRTNASYAHRGQQLLKCARARFPDAEDSVDALVRLCANPNWVLRPATTRSYLAAIIHTLEKEVEQNQLERQRALDGIEQISRLLVERRGRPEPRTSRKKTLDCTEEERDLIHAELVRRARHGDVLAGVIQLVLEISPRLGVRPSEWPDSRLVGSVLLVRNGKNSGGRATGPTRPISLERMPGDLVRVADGLLSIVRRLVKKFGSMERLCRILAERLARVCKRLGLVRISIYTLRHVAIATWKRGGLSAEEIAALAGHVSTRTAWSHYARGKHGWHPNNVCVAAAQETIAYVKSHTKSKYKRGLWPPWTPPADWGCAVEGPRLTM